MSLLKSIKEKSPDVQVIMMTGEPTFKTPSDGMLAGASDYLVKPIRKEQLLSAVEAVVSNAFLKNG